MKRVLCMFCLIAVVLLGACDVFAAFISDAASFSNPNKFGVTGLYTLIGTDTSGHGTFSIGFVGDLSEFSLPGDPRTPQLLELGFHVGFSLKDRFEIGLLLPYHRLEVSDEAGFEGFDESGLSNIVATAKYRLLNERDIVPALAMYTQVAFPTSNDQEGLGNGAIAVTLGGAATKHIGPVNLYGNLGFSLSGWSEGDPNPLFDNYQHALLYGFGLEFPSNNSRFRIFSELTFVHEFGDENEDQIVTFTGQEIEDVVDDAGQVSFGAAVNLFGGLFLSGGAAFQILGEEPVPDAPEWRGFLNLSYVFGQAKAMIPIPPQAPVQVKPLPTPVAEAPNQCPEITDISISDSMIGGGEYARIAVTAIDPDGDKLYYVWSSTQGELTGSEAQIAWKAPECMEIGQDSAAYNIAVEVSDGKCTANRTFTIAVDCSPQRPGQAPDVVILFPSGTTKLNNIAKAQLDNLAPLLKQFPDQRIMVSGHTDATGSEKTNQQIGLKRAESVKSYLVQRHGIAPERIVTSSYGASQPVASNDTKAGRDKNRRVEIYRAY